MKRKYLKIKTLTSIYVMKKNVNCRQSIHQSCQDWSVILAGLHSNFGGFTLQLRRNDFLKGA